jgi:hypothetical protein
MLAERLTIAKAPAKRLQPAFRPRQSGCLHSVGSAEFANRFRQIIANRSLRQTQLSGDVSTALSLAGSPKNLAFAVGKRICFPPSLGC